ncbi:TIGR03088 family PEP-CTERM/XrtA system glycosyltransferase [Roseateles oligotrophus]|uniref:TIGR03088 family PEP-CTERM/XrtA system glycosyltransferase n=1 Tax=Roseateles oligotrophus TaxID=1769250 RepID=A0ABT2YFD9_9BURK|nr:TIGR03088 family PEP-CTERM/XrtA system glycosyltransferase [Roseateles oligotrophus]MCV2368731.1 TIGR03088 family PEP-CTERM/XrtA system glycosyltransferase [Roseateles oligotrophus]
MTTDSRPLVLHVVYRFDTGGLENGVVNLINHMPADVYRHVVLALTEVTDFRLRIARDDVEFIALNKPPGHGVWLYPRLYQLFKRLRPAIVHSRNLAALEVQMPAWAAGVPVRIHGEHGRDMGDLDGSNRKLQRVRRVYRPFVHHYVALSSDLGAYLQDAVHVPPAQITQACNGVDTARFAPGAAGPERLPGCPFDPAQHWLVGTVGRMSTVKDQLMLAQAFLSAQRQAPALRERLRLVMVGEGPLRAQAQTLLAEAGLADLAWLPGERTDVPQIMRTLHCYALPSLAEGISNTILEAMASALPVLATEVGGNAELIVQGQTGLLVPAAAPEAMAQALLFLASDPDAARKMGEQGRARVEARFSLPAMIRTYQNLYDQQLNQRRPARVAAKEGVQVERSK